MKNNSIFIRNFDAEKYIETFMVSAVAAILVIRTFLVLTGFPQIGNSNLHIAHLLWGGFLMLISIIILLFFLTKGAEKFAALLGGIGFGTFLDEIGKFVTQDNDYFFEPSVSLMYITFLLILFAVHYIKTGWGITEQEYLINAINELRSLSGGELSKDDKSRALNYLSHTDDTDPLVNSVRDIISKIKTTPPSQPGSYDRLKSFLNNKYDMLTQLRSFNLAIMLFFISKFVITIGYIFVLIFIIGVGWENILSTELVEHLYQRGINLSFVDIAEFFSSLLSGVFACIGIYYLRKSRLKAYEMFKWSILISIFLTQIFIFYNEQFSALIGLTINILILIAIRFMIEREELSLSKKVN